jgi:hypothetical protein
VYVNNCQQCQYYSKQLICKLKLCQLLRQGTWLLTTTETMQVATENYYSYWILLRITDELLMQ